MPSILSSNLGGGACSPFKWSYAVDIWAFGIMVWSLFHKEYLYWVGETESDDLDPPYLAQMEGLLGPPPLDLLQKSSKSQHYLDEKGRWKESERVEIQQRAMEDREDRLEDVEKEQLLSFMRQLITWRRRAKISEGPAQ